MVIIAQVHIANWPSSSVATLSATSLDGYQIFTGGNWETVWLTFAVCMSRVSVLAPVSQLGHANALIDQIQIFVDQDSAFTYVVIINLRIEGSVLNGDFVRYTRVFGSGNRHAVVCLTIFPHTVPSPPPAMRRPYISGGGISEDSSPLVTVSP